MRSKKGFTLIEVISVLVILGLLATIVVTQYATTIRESRKRLNEEQKSRLIEVAKDISLNNKSCLELAKENVEVGSKITLDQMYKNGYIANSELKDIEENVTLNSCIVIKWDTTYSKFEYIYSDNCNEAKTCNISAESEKVIVSSFYLGESNVNYTSSENINYYLRYSATISAEYCVTLETEANCNWKKLDMSSNLATGSLKLTKTENIAHLYIRNNNKNIITAIDDSIIYDREEPTCVWRTPNNSYVNKDSTTEIVLNCTDIAGIKNTELLSSALDYNEDLISVSDAIITTNGTSKDFKFTVAGKTGNGTVNLTLKSNVLSDNSGNILSTSKTSGNIYLDNVLPDGDVTVGESGSRYTNTENITLRFSNVSSDIDKICVSNYSEGSCSFINYTSTYPWVLTTGDGQKNVYVSFMDKAGNVNKKSAVVYLDTTPPICQPNPVYFSATSGIYNLKNGSYIDYSINCHDLQSGDINASITTSMLYYTQAGKVETSILSGSSGPGVRIRALTGDGNVSVYLAANQIFDSAGNGNVMTKIADIKVDNTLPYNNSIVLNFNASITNLEYAVVSLDSDIKNENGYYCLKVNSNTSCSNSEWTEFTSSTSVNLGHNPGTYTVYAFFKDKAGNISSSVSDSIKYDNNAISCVLLESTDAIIVSSSSTNLADLPYSVTGNDWTSNNTIPKVENQKYYFSYIRDQNNETNYCELSLK